MFKVDNLYDVQNVEIISHINTALRAHVTLQRDVDYMVVDGEVLIVDQFTGRTMPGRRFSEGLHKLSKLKKVLRFKMNLRLWHLLHSKITSECITN